MTILQILWFFLIFVLIAGYFVLDGFDLGAGVLYPVLAKDETERAYIRRSIGPVWDGNEVWLLTAGGALFAAFPGDVVTLADAPTGAAGTYDVARSSCFADGERAGTEIILKTRGE